MTEKIVEANKKLCLAKIDGDNLKKFLYVEDNLNPDNKTFFFGVPQIGSWFAFKLEIKDYMYKESWEDCLVKLREYWQNHEEYNKELSIYESKLREMNENETIEETRDELVKPTPPIKELPVYSQKTYIIVFESFGQYTPLESKTIQSLASFCFDLEEQWSKKNLIMLEKDIKQYVNYLKGEEGRNLNEIEHEIKEETERVSSEAEQLINETEIAHDKKHLVLNFLINESIFKFWFKLLKDNFSEFELLKKNNFLKFEEILICFLFFSGKTKQEFFFPKTNRFNWKVAKNLIGSWVIDFFETYSYNHLPTGSFLEYQKIDNLYNIIFSMNMLEVSSYNFGFYALGNTLMYLLKVILDLSKKEYFTYCHLKEVRDSQLKKEEERMERRNEEMEKAKEEFESTENQEKMINELKEKAEERKKIREEEQNEQKEEQDKEKEEQNEEKAKEEIKKPLSSDHLEEKKSLSEEEIPEMIEFDQESWIMSFNSEFPPIEIPTEPLSPRFPHLSKDFSFEE